MYKNIKFRIVRNPLTESFHGRPGTRRYIETGLSGPINKTILNSVLGQLSDGMWENTPAMNKYWKHADIEENNGELYIVVEDNWPSGFRGRDATWIRNFFASKIKVLVYDELGLGSGKSWNRQDTAQLDYLDSGQVDVTVSAAYRAYETLKGRKTIGKYDL